MLSVRLVWLQFTTDLPEKGRRHLERKGDPRCKVTKRSGRIERGRERGGGQSAAERQIGEEGSRKEGRKELEKGRNQFEKASIDDET